MKIKNLNTLMVAVMFVLAIASSISFFGGYALSRTVPFVAIAFIALSFVKMPKMSFQATIYREVWTGEVIKFVGQAMKDSFLKGIADYSKYVSNVGDEMQAIHLASMNVLPEVLINNTTYPIGIADQSITDILITLAKFQTVATPITDDEMYASSVKKMELVKDRHGRAITQAIIRKGLHALAPSGNTAKMPVIPTTGPDDGTGRRKMLMKDLLTFKGNCDTLEIDEESRVLVLCTDHVNDLISEDAKLEAFFYNRTSGEIQPRLLSFEIHTHVSSPYYTPSTLAKLSYGAVPSVVDGSEDRKASVFFSRDRAAKAMGWTKMYLSKSDEDTQNQRSLVNFRQNAIIMPTAEEFRGAIVSDNV